MRRTRAGSDGVPGAASRVTLRLFADAGTTLPRHVLARRLDRAYVLLRDAAEPAVGTVDVAARCGFTSTAWFSQAFKTRFGVTAGAVRRLGADELSA